MIFAAASTKYLTGLKTTVSLMGFSLIHSRNLICGDSCDVVGRKRETHK